MKKTIIVLSCCSLIFLAGVCSWLFISAKNKAPENTATSEADNKTFGYYEYNDQKFYYKSDEQAKKLENISNTVRTLPYTDLIYSPVKEALFEAGVIDSKQRLLPMKEIDFILKQLPADSSNLSSEIDKVAGCPSGIAGSGREMLVYFISEDEYILVISNKEVKLFDSTGKSKYIYWSGLGYKAEGWTDDEITKYVEQFFE